MLSLVSAAASAGIAGRWANNHCLQMLMQQPGPMGGEVCELIRQRDPEYPLLRWTQHLQLHLGVKICIE